MELFDSHAHYNDEKFNENREDIIKQIYGFGVTKFINSGYDSNSSRQALELAKKYNYMYITCGISPNDIANTEEKILNQISEIEKLVVEEVEANKEQSKIVGIGEIGLDYHWNTENKELQKFAFIKQIELANKLKLPIVIHTREAVNDTIDIIKKHTPNKKGVFHCCPFNRELVKQGLNLGFYISFAGPTTFKNSKNAEEIVNMVPLEKLLIETDSPYLAPEPKRGTINDSRNVKYIAEKIAEFKGLTIEEVAKATYDNAKRIFEIK